MHTTPWREPGLAHVSTARRTETSELRLPVRCSPDIPSGQLTVISDRAGHWLYRCSVRADSQRPLHIGAELGSRMPGGDRCLRYTSFRTRRSAVPSLCER